MLSPLVTVASSVAAEVAEHAEHSESVNHWVIGAITLAILLGALLGLMAFARGREHS